MKSKRVIDLSFGLFNGMPIWPTQPNFLCEQTMNIVRDRSTLHVIRQMSTHTGTHVDTPLHFVAGGKTVDQLPIDSFIGEGVVIDLSHKRAKEEITVQDMKAYDDAIKVGDVLMIYTGWDKRLGFNPEYLFEWPYLVEETAKYIVEKGVKALGVDMLSVGGWDEEVPGHGPVARKGSQSETHRILLGAGILIVEVLRNLDRVLDGEHARRAYFVYAPISIKGAEGGPCRALAFLE
jgi:arylformamidase